MGGSKKPKPVVVTTGYRYFMDVQMIVSAGPIEQLHGLDYGERAMWRGSVTDTGDLSINNPSLFGGEKAEGGVAGRLSVLFGKDDQGRHDRLVSTLSGQIPASRGYFGLMFSQFMWSANNPYLKSVWARVTNIKAGWDERPDGVWYPEKSAIPRHTSEFVDYTVNLKWVPEDVKTPQSIAYALETKGESDSIWQEVATGTFAGGVAPTEAGLTGGTVSVDTANSNTSFDSIYSGQLPTGVRTHKANLRFESREWRIIKTAGTFDDEGVILSGLDHGGQVEISETFTNIPAYFDMNPAHILYKLLTLDAWQVRLPFELIDDAAWREAADTLYDEAFGLSFSFVTGETKDHIQTVLNHINGYFKEDLETGKVQLKLIRGGYDPLFLTTLDNDNSALVSYSKATGGKQPNEIVVTYRDDNEDVKVSPAASNLASISKVGVIRTEVDYPGVHRAGLAYNLAKRDLKARGSELVRMTRTTNRILWNHSRGDVVLVTDPNLRIEAVPYRIVEITKNTETAGEIRVDMVEDVFGFAMGSFDVDNDNQTDPYLEVVLEHPFAVLPFELPFYLVRTLLGIGYVTDQPEGYAYGAILVSRNNNGAFTTDVDTYSSLDDSLYLGASGGGSYTPTGQLVLALSKTATSFNVLNLVDFISLNFDTDGEVFALVNNELMAVDTFNDQTGVMTVRRGVLDTVPQAHASGSTIRIITPSVCFDPVQRLDGDLVFYKAQPQGNGQSPQIYDLEAEDIIYNSRAERPYPPGRFALNGELYNSAVDGAVVVSWAHRDRTLQTTLAVPHTANSIGPEVGTTYTLKVYETGGALLGTYTGITGDNYTVPAGDIAGKQDLSFELFAVRDGLESWTKHDHEADRYGFGLQFGKSFGGKAP